MKANTFNFFGFSWTCSYETNQQEVYTEERRFYRFTRLLFSFPHNPALEKTMGEAAASLLNSRSTLYAPFSSKQLLSDFARYKRFLMEIPLTIVNLD